jgi:hypothetical protein
MSDSISEMLWATTTRRVQVHPSAVVGHPWAAHSRQRLVGHGYAHLPQLAQAIGESSVDYYRCRSCDSRFELTSRKNLRKVFLRVTTEVMERPE